MWVKTDPSTAGQANIIASHSLNREAMLAHVRLYRTIMYGESPLTRAEREAMAVTVSAVNDCHYWVVQHGESLTRESGQASLAEAVASGTWDELEPRMRALCRYALLLTRAPAEVSEADLAPLRALGLDDRGIVDANQVVSYFNYVNRIADGLGVELEDEWPSELKQRQSYPLAADPFPAVEAAALPWISVEQMREVDRVIIEELAISLEQMMENAGRALATVALRLLGQGIGRRVVVLAGPGGNGGGGLVAARHLALAGADIDLRLATPPERLAPTTRRQFEILRAIGIDPGVGRAGSERADLVLDALLGYSQDGAPRGETASLIRWSAGRRIVSLDVPSGLELTTGLLHDPHVSAVATVTLAAPKEGLRHAPAEEAVGRLLVADISVPPLVFAALGVPFGTPFARGPLVEVRGGQR